MTTTKTKTETRVAPGTPATYAIGGDRYPMTVVEVSKSGHIVRARRCRTRAAHKSGQGFIFVEMQHAEVETYTRRGDGAYRPKGRKCGRLYIGTRTSYSDPHF